MAHLDVLKTVHAPVTADGSLIKNSFGVVVATVHGDSFLAAAVAAMINYGMTEAERANLEYAKQEESKARMLSSYRNGGAI